MKKIIIILSLIFIFFNINYAQDNSGNNGYLIFLKDNIGKEIVVNLSNIDVSISGVLIEVYDDGIILQTKFNNFYIQKNSIAYIKIKLQNEKK